ncbi:glycoside hydrolase family 3 C-terminal domain-containing protein [Streptantibioticus parmotrematis]|uniref:glycoside hydrolase family 3 C-terminal domain-containing protein n=1 Tax=Streptantibioticus parmotrematis TaxID=2873249 RepID=UPI0033E8A144
MRQPSQPDVPDTDTATTSPHLAALSLAEKAALTSGRNDFTTEAAPAADVPSFLLADGPHGLRLPRPDGSQAALRSEKAATCFPPAVALGSSWDVDLARRVAAAIGAEAAAHGVKVVLGPGINIKRSPLCGRNFEYFSEDPLLAAELGGAMVRGLQGAGVGACVKHYAANNQETDRMRVSADVDPRPLREIYLRAFERIVRRDRPWSVMAAYNGLNGTPVTEHTWLLTDVLRTEWGFDGVVVSDWGAVVDRVAALRAGLDLQMPGIGPRPDEEVAAAVARGELPEAVLDRAVARLARLATRPDPSGADTDPESLHEAHHRLAAEAADRCVVLLKNDGGLLPLDPSRGAVAVIGELARTPRYQGGGSSQVTPTRLENVLDHLTELSDGARVDFAPGYTLPGGPDVADPAEDGVASADDSGTQTTADDRLRAQAVRLACAADTTVLFLGLPGQEESEGFDRDHLDLPERQLDLLRAVLEVTSRVVVVLSNGGVVRTSPWDERVPALLEGWLLGQAGGGALARVLFGAVDPSGRLAETIPLRLQDTPSHLSFPGDEGHVRYGEGVFVGYRGYDARDTPVAYPFGHGLSYTTFAWTDLAVTPGTGAELDDTAATFAVTVTNTGSREGREVVQFYTSLPGSAVARPVRELRGFATVELAPGESGRVSVSVRRRDLAHYSVREDAWHVEGGGYVVEAAASSRDVRLSGTLEVTGDPSHVRLTGRNTLTEWLAHPVGGPLLAERLSGLDTTAGDHGGLLADPAVLRFLAGVPLDVIADFPVSPLDRADVTALADAAARGAAPSSS